MDIHFYFKQYLSLGAEAEAALHALLRMETYAKQALIQQPGSSCRTVYFMHSGIARIFYDKDGKDITEHFAFAGQLIVRAESLFTGQPTRKGIQALSPAEVIALDASRLAQLYERFHEIERLFRLIFEQAHVSTIRRIESLQFNSASERYRELLTETDLLRHIPLKHIASYLGITQVSLSRIRASMK